MKSDVLLLVRHHTPNNSLLCHACHVLSGDDHDVRQFFYAIMFLVVLIKFRPFSQMTQVSLWNVTIHILLNILLMFLARVSISNKSPVVQVTGWWWTTNNPLPVCTTRLQWFKFHWITQLKIYTIYISNYCQIQLYARAICKSITDLIWFQLPKATLCLLNKPSLWCWMDSYQICNISQQAHWKDHLCLIWKWYYGIQKTAVHDWLRI